MARVPVGLAYLIGLALGVAILVGAGFEAKRSASVGSSDFAVVWTGARALLEGGDPYLASSFQATSAHYGTTRATIPIETYPPWVTVGFIPLGLLDLPAAAAVWSYGGLVLAAVALRSLLRSLLTGLPAIHTLAGVTLVVSQPAIGTFVTGQWTFVHVAAISAVVLALRTGHSWLAVAATLPLLAKPQLFPFALWALGFAALAGRPRQTAFVVGGSAAWLGIIVGAFLLAPRWTSTWLTGVAIGVAIEDQSAPTIAHWPTAAFGAWGLVITAAIFGVALWAGRSADPRSEAGLAVWLGLSFLLAIYIRSYDQLLFIVPLILAAGGIAAVSERRALAVGSVGLGLLLIGATVLYGAVAAARQNEDVSVLLAAALFAVLVFAHRIVDAPGPEGVRRHGMSVS